MRPLQKASILVVAVCTIMALAHADCQANVFASQLAVSNPDGSPFDGNFSDGSGAELTFTLNDTASSVTVAVIDVSDGATVASIDAGAMSRGRNSVTWDGSGSESGGRYIFRVTAEQPNASNEDWTVFFDSGDIDIFTRGHVVYVDQADPNFGLIMTSNDGGPLGTGINIFNADGSFHDPFLVAADVSSGGAINYGTNAPLFAVLDSLGRIYVSNGDLGQVMRINRDLSATVVIEGLTAPKGLYVEDFTLYVAANDQVLRANIGTADSFAAGDMEVVGEFSGFFPHQVMLDDAGAMYLTLRQSNDLGSNGRGIRKYDLSGALPVTDDDATWFLMEDKTFIANDMLMDRGSDRSSAADDILYFVTRAGGGNDQDGIWRINDINSFFPDTVRIVTEDAFYGSDENVQARATIDFDAAGNIIFMENANEHVFFISPPGEGATNSYTTTGFDTLTVDIPSSVDAADDLLPESYRLEAAYPNPFNPSTNISYTLGKAGQTTITVYNLLGKAIRHLVDENQPAGSYTITWHGRDDANLPVASGVYIITLRSGEFNQSQRITLLK